MKYQRRHRCRSSHWNYRSTAIFLYIYTAYCMHICTFIFLLKSRRLCLQTHETNDEKYGEGRKKGGKKSRRKEERKESKERINLFRENEIEKEEKKGSLALCCSRRYIIPSRSRLLFFFSRNACYVH